MFNKSVHRIINNFFSTIGFYIPQTLLFLLFSTLVADSFATKKETIERLINEDRVLSSPLELHITSNDSALINSTVSLNHEDAWLFFDNIKPSDVIAKYRSSILINGQALGNGANGRVAIYMHGTVIMPFGYNFKPLMVYTGENFGGDSIKLAIEVYHNNLGAFDNAIQSFKLKRGYQATFANTSDGTGYSRVFIANDADIEINLPDLLINKVSFIRVFKYEWVTKKGWAGWDANDIVLANPTWRYDWSAGGNTTNDVEYVPIKQHYTSPGWSEINSNLTVSHLLGYNEPDHAEQANVTVEQAIEAWPEFMKSGLRLGAPATTNFNWVIDFVKRCNELNYRVDFVAVHAYWGTDPSGYLSSLSWVHNATGRPIWITEWNYGANWTSEWWPDNTPALTPANEEYAYQKIKAIVDFFDQTPWIERYSIYNWVEDRRAIVLNGELTKAGEYYSNNKSVEAFNRSYEVIPHWNYKNPELSIRYFSLRNSIRVAWNDPNGELSREYILEKKINGGDFESIYSTDDFSKEFYLDPLDPELYGNISYRLKLQTAQGEFLTSNVVSYYQTAGDKEIQVGNFNINSLDISTTYFSKKYTSKPLVILGIPSFNNPVPMTQRVNTVSVTSFMFYLNPWSYLSNPQVTKPDMMATMALPAGTYNFGGLKAEAHSIDSVTRDWVAVNFSQNFDKVPVVFPTIVSSANPYPLTVGVRNVTSTGFEMCLKSEEVITATLLFETINFLAIEAGNGTIDGKRITVGHNNEGDGISETPLEISYDSTYSEPAVFAGLLSAEDNFASTLRYSTTGDFSFELIKQREMSGGESLMKADDYGWMVMDLASDQPDIGTAANEIQMMSPVTFYPNPAKDIIHFNFDKQTRVEVLDITGQKLMEAKVFRNLNINSLPTGMYVLKIAGKLPAKLIKIE